MELHNFPWSRTYGVYDTGGWFSPGTWMIISLFSDHSPRRTLSPCGPAILSLTVTDIKYV